jgi:tetratricopeptide (TPR) repeat protein
MTDEARYREWIEEGLQASREGRTSHAIDCWLQASREQPRSGVPHFLLGSERASAGDIPAAERSLANAVVLEPGFHLARYQLGLLQFSSDRPASALVTWQPLADLPPGEPLGHFVRGFASLATEQIPEALAHMRAGLACGDVQEALSGDIQKVIDALERLSGPSGDRGTPDVRHVLLSAYARGLH